MNPIRRGGAMHLELCELLVTAPADLDWRDDDQTVAIPLAHVRRLCTALRVHRGLLDGELPEAQPGDRLRLVLARRGLVRFPDRERDEVIRSLEELTRALEDGTTGPTWFYRLSTARGTSKAATAAREARTASDLQVLEHAHEQVLQQRCESCGAPPGMPCDGGPLADLCWSRVLGAGLFP